MGNYMVKDPKHDETLRRFNLYGGVHEEDALRDYDDRDESDGGDSSLDCDSVSSGSDIEVIESSEDGSRLIKNNGHGRKLLAELANQRRTAIQVGGREFPCHRAVLATTPYFKAMLSSNLAESSSKVIHLHGTDSISFSKILDFLYTGEIRISEDDVQDILKTAHMLQFDKILKYCQKFIQGNLCPANCLGVMRLADMYGLSDLKKSARKMVVSNFSDANQDEEFLSLSVQELLDLLGDEDLKVTNEDDVVNFVIRWLDHAPEKRQTVILQILQEIRLTCVKVIVLQKLESHPVIRESTECLAKITAAKEKHHLGKKVEGEETSRARRGISDNLAIIVGGWMAVKKPQTEPVQLTPGPRLQSMICLDPDSQQYYHIANLPTPVSGYMSVASAGRHLYVTGGRVHPLVGHGPHTPPSKQAFRYDFPSDTWLKLPDMPRGRAGHHSVIVDGKLFVVGSDAEATSLVTKDCYDPEEDDDDAEETTSLVTMDCYDPEEAAWIKIHESLPINVSSKWTVTGFGAKVAIIEASTKQTPLAFALFGHSFLETQRSRVGWYCRDLAALEEKDEQEGSD
ncbi:KLHL24 [Branchiostoma lanceolatum]|uniref:KLHL24 protein n=1 Tax=Branchiostoma lanceolatum TaxID=7740 RepID=A0A8J9ZWY6_BRALA|nr:KLHL24 [Branchiostoma lanceolatum]